MAPHGATPPTFPAHLRQGTSSLERAGMSRCGLPLPLQDAFLPLAGAQSML